MSAHDGPGAAVGARGEPVEPAYLAVLDILRCPYCRGTFVTPGAATAPAASEELVCSACGRAYPVRGGIPVLLVDEARLPGSEPGSEPGGARG